MTALLLTGLFAFSATFAIAAIMGTWRANAASILSLRQQMRDCTEMRDFRYSVKTVEVRYFGAQIHRPDFRASRRPLREDPLLAAA
jgi:hypothetical protein